MDGPEQALLIQLMQRHRDVTEMRQRLAREATALRAAMLSLRVGRHADVVLAQLTHDVKDLIEPDLERMVQ